MTTSVMISQPEFSVRDELALLREENARLALELTEQKELNGIAPAFFGFLAPTGEVLVSNDLSLCVIESTSEQVVGRLFWNCPWWRSLPLSAAKIRHAIAEGAKGISSQFDIEYSSFHQGIQQVRWVAFTMRPFSDHHGAVSRIAVTGIDITERKDAERALAAEQHKLEMLFEQSPAAMAIWRGPDLIFEKVNQKFQAIFGDRPLVGKGFLEALPEFYDQPFAAIIRKVLETGEPYIGHEALARLAPFHGAPIEERYYDFSYVRLNDAKGNPYGIYDHAVDVTARVLARKSLEEKEARFRQLADSMPAIVWSATPEGVPDYYNQRWYELTGTAPGELKPKDGLAPIHPEDDSRVREAWRESVRSGQTFQVEYRYKLSSGHFRWHLGRAIPVRDADGQIVKWFGTSTDIHNLKQTQEELLRANTELARFAFVASHDLKEPLRTIANYSELLRMEYEGKLGATADSFINFITLGVKRIYDLIDDLLSYSRVGATETEAVLVDTNHILSDVRESLKSAIDETKAEIISPSLPPVYSQPGQLLQLFQNLIGNAIKYRGKEIPRIEIAVSKRNSDWLFSVRDNGIGIAPEHHDRIFVLFQRLHSKDQYSGTGIGLAVCKKIVERHGGRIWVESALGAGSTFYFTLPLQPPDRNTDS